MRPEDLEWLSSLSESEIDFLIAIKQLVIQRTEVIGHKEIAAKFDVRILRALSVILLEFFKEQVRSDSTFPNIDEVLISLDRCSLATSDQQGGFGSSSLEESCASLKSNHTQARIRIEAMPNKAGGGDGREQLSEHVIVNIYGTMHAELNQIYSKMTELEMKVSDTPSCYPLRRCYCMIGGEDHQGGPTGGPTKQGFEEVVSRLNEAMEKEKEKDIAEFELKYKIRMKKLGGEVVDDGDRKEGSVKGVLVDPARLRD